MKHEMPNAAMVAGVVAVLAAGAVIYPRKQAALATVQLYYAQEMLAALLLFAIGFAVVAMVILILVLLDWGLYRGLVWTRLYTVHATQRLHLGWVQVEQFGRKHFRHSPQPVAR